jgi:hypothetical protein
MLELHEIVFGPGRIQPRELARRYFVDEMQAGGGAG